MDGRPLLAGLFIKAIRLRERHSHDSTSEWDYLRKLFIPVVRTHLAARTQSHHMKTNSSELNVMLSVMRS